MCSDAPKPDANIGIAARDNIALSREAMDYYRQKDKEQAPRQARMDDLTEKLAQQQMSTSQQQDAQAQDLWRRYKETGVPMEDAVMRDASNYDSQATMDRAAGQAATDVSASMAAGTEAQRRSIARMGVNPADGRALTMEQDMAATGALATAGAMNKARTDREMQGIMLRKDAAGMARGMTGTAAQTYGVASAAGGQAAGAVGSSISSANSIAGAMGQGFGIGIQGNQSGASILNQMNAAETSAANAKGSQTAGLAGTAATIGIAI
jgi:hypothetical protein